MITDLDFYEKPQYTIYRRILKQIFLENNLQFDLIYDWMVHPTAHIEEAYNCISNIDSIFEDLENEIEYGEDFEEISKIVEKYENDTTRLNFHTEVVKKENRKYEIMPVDEESEGEEKNKAADNTQNLQKKSPKKLTGKKMKEKCKLI